MYAYSNNGLGFRVVPSDYIVQPGEVLLPTNNASPTQLAAAFPGYAAAIAARQVTAGSAVALNAGIAITSTGTPALNGTYALDQGSINAIDEVVLYIDTNGTFPEGAATLPYPDAAGAMHVFPSVAEFKAFATAAADLVALIDEYASSGGTVGSIPSNVITIA